MKINKKQIIGWLAVIITLSINMLWTIWGMLENFHEGWYSPSLLENLGLFFLQYIPISLIFILIPLLAMRWKKAGLLIFIALAVFSIFFFSGASFQVVYLLIAIPMILLGLLFFFGEARPTRLAQALIIVPPLLTMIIIAIPNILRIQQRLNDGDFGTRSLDCQGLPLLWAARGPGFPETGATWQEAYDSCRYLSDDGDKIMDTVQDIWHLPDIEEAVRCQTKDGENAGGRWLAQEQIALYEHAPDKETPIWDSYSHIIYYWTADQNPEKENRAYIIDYKGGIFDKDMRYSPAYHSFRCVRPPEK